MKRDGWVKIGILIIFVFFTIYGGKVLAKTFPPAQSNQFEIQGPIIGEVVYPGEVGDLRDLENQAESTPDSGIVPLKYTPGTEPKGPSGTIAGWQDPLAQTNEGAGLMPGVLQQFPGISYGSGSLYYHPPDTNGDVGPNHYIQTVNISMAIYRKSDGFELVKLTLDQFFNNTSTPCDYSNRGDPVVVYDRFADRWIITDFSLPGGASGYLECVAVSKTGDPVSGGWWMYGVRISMNAINDYPKIGVWSDAYYFSFNMFQQPGDAWGGVQVWAMDRAKMLNGQNIQTVSFSLSPATGYASLLPSHALTLPPAGAPNYFASVEPPNKLEIWEFHYNSSAPASSTFTGPLILNIADFAIAASVPQPGTSQVLDSLSFRPMMQLIYRKRGTTESLWMNHTVASRGVAAVRWYEVRDPNGTPVLFQQGTYNPDLNHRWMGALAVDQDGNMAVGYSVSGSSMYPAIRYAGRLAGEIPGLITQGEATMIQGTGSQTTSNRWGDYSSMSVDVDGCTFWYTTEYLATSGSTWLTRIGSFEFPSCGQPKGYLSGYVRNAITLSPVPGVKVVANTTGQTLSVLTDASGFYTLTLTAGTYDLVGGPLPPGYPIPATVSSVFVTVGNTTTQDILLNPQPYLVEQSKTIDDNVTYANHNGYPEPGEQGIKLTINLTNTGAITATNIIAHLHSSTSGVIVDVADASYPNIPAGGSRANNTPFIISLNGSIPCGRDLVFREFITTDQGLFFIDFTLNASAILPRENVLIENVESGAIGWSHGGSLDRWAITTAYSHSPTHSWSDGTGDYLNYTNSWLRSPTVNLTGKRRIQLGGWYRWALEAGYDYVYLEYSLDGGSSWQSSPLLTFNGIQASWTQKTVNVPALDGQANVAIRYHLYSDPGVVMDGIYLDDITISHEPFACNYVPVLPGIPNLIVPYNNSKKTNPVTFQWVDSGSTVPPTNYLFVLDGITTTVPAPTTMITQTHSLGIHEWKVIAESGAGRSPASSTWSFEVLTVTTGIPGTPILLDPLDGSSVENRWVTFHWTDSGTGGTPNGYEFSLDGTPIMTFTMPVTDYPFYIPSGSHTWSVRSFNDDGYSDYAVAWIIKIFYWMFLPFSVR